MHNDKLLKLANIFETSLKKYSQGKLSDSLEIEVHDVLLSAFKNWFASNEQKFSNITASMTMNPDMKQALQGYQWLLGSVQIVLDINGNAINNLNQALSFRFGVFPQIKGSKGQDWGSVNEAISFRTKSALNEFLNSEPIKVGLKGQFIAEMNKVELLPKMVQSIKGGSFSVSTIEQVIIPVVIV